VERRPADRVDGDADLFRRTHGRRNDVVVATATAGSPPARWDLIAVVVEGADLLVSRLRLVPAERQVRRSDAPVFVCPELLAATTEDVGCVSCRVHPSPSAESVIQSV